MCKNMLMHKFDFISYIRDFQLMRIQLIKLFAGSVQRVLLDPIDVILPSDCARRRLQDGKIVSSHVVR